jgi:hypothetical protein
MNNGNGVQPVVELATTNGNGYYPYPVMYGNGGFGGNGGFFGGDGIWAIILIALLFGNGGWGGFGGFGGFGGGFGMTDGGLLGYAIGNNATKGDLSDGFNSLHLSNQIEGVRDGVYGLSNQLCNVGNDITSAINTTAYNAEIAAANRQMANMNTAFDLSRQFADCCCENRLGIANLNSTILSENCADRAALADGLKDVLINQTANTQRILDQLCNDKIDEKNEKIADLQRQLSMKDLQASQIAQNAFISQGFANEVDALYNRLSSCPVPTTPVYGRTPIFTCNGNNGCGCGFNTTSQFI